MGEFFAFMIWTSYVLYRLMEPLEEGSGHRVGYGQKDPAEARRRRKRHEKELRRLAQQRKEVLAKEKALRKAQDSLEAAERKADEDEQARQEAMMVVFETAQDAFPEMPAVSLHES